MRKLSILSLLAMMIAIGGCGGGGTSADPLGTDSIIFADASGTGQVDTNGALTLKATVRNAAGAAVVGREVSFGFVSNRSGATLASSSSANTNVAGEATILYRAGATAGFDVVRAWISNGAYMDVNITVGTVAASGRAVSVTANPSAVAPGANSYILATVTDSSGSPVPGETVTFTRPTGTGTFVTATTVTTDVQGAASAIYTTGNNLTQEVIQATILTGGIASTAIISKTGGGAAAGNRISISANPSEYDFGGVIPAGLILNSRILVTVTDNNGNPVRGETVTFAMVTPASGTIVSPVEVITDTDGKAVAVYRVTTSATTATTPPGFATPTTDVIRATLLSNGATDIVIVTVK